MRKHKKTLNKGKAKINKKELRKHPLVLRPSTSSTSSQSQDSSSFTFSSPRSRPKTSQTIDSQVDEALEEASSEVLNKLYRETILGKSDKVQEIRQTLDKKKCKEINNFCGTNRQIRGFCNHAPLVIAHKNICSSIKMVEMFSSLPLFCLSLCNKYIYAQLIGLPLDYSIYFPTKGPWIESWIPETSQKQCAVSSIKWNKEKEVRECFTKALMEAKILTGRSSGGRQNTGNKSILSKEGCRYVDAKNIEAIPTWRNLAYFFHQNPNVFHKVLDIFATKYSEMLGDIPGSWEVTSRLGQPETVKQKYPYPKEFLKKDGSLKKSYRKKAQAFRKKADKYEPKKGERKDEIIENKIKKIILSFIRHDLPGKDKNIIQNQLRQGKTDKIPLSPGTIKGLLRELDIHRDKVVKRETGWWGQDLEWSPQYTEYLDIYEAELKSY